MATEWGLAVVDGDIEFETVAGARRPRVVQDVDNLAQALTLRVLTPLGDDRFNILYGIDVRRAFVDPHSVRETKDLIRMNLVRALATDRRVRDVREIVFEDELPVEDTAAQLAIEQARRRRTWTAIVALDTVLGDALTLRLGVNV